mmetsp:Transcript_20577/g.45044  ORF Transcript_20577/g.45044 Transcript_20577/m.45044 type:complete len:264 (+) Transcript_20577:677-1468(+)
MRFTPTRPLCRPWAPLPATSSNTSSPACCALCAAAAADGPGASSACCLLLLLLAVVAVAVCLSFAQCPCDDDGADGGADVEGGQGVGEADEAREPPPELLTALWPLGGTAAAAVLCVDALGAAWALVAEVLGSRARAALGARCREAGRALVEGDVTRGELMETAVGCATGAAGAAADAASWTDAAREPDDAMLACSEERPVTGLRGLLAGGGVDIVPMISLAVAATSWSFSFSAFSALRDNISRALLRAFSMSRSIFASSDWR